MKYFANDGYKEYEVYKGDITEGVSINCISIDKTNLMNLFYSSSTVSRTDFYYDYWQTKSLSRDYYKEDKTTDVGNSVTNVNQQIINGNPTYFDNSYSPKTQYGMIGKVMLCLGENNNCDSDTGCTDSNNQMPIYLYLGDDCKTIYYLTDRKYIDWHIRPKNIYEYDESIKSYVDRRYLSNYYNNLDSFEKLLLNPDTNPKYTAKFNIYSEDDYGFKTRIETFTFPTNLGGYNIGNTTTFNTYINFFEEIGDLYDEYFSDNIYRMLTHEAIKNFDWAYSREEIDENDDYVLGNTKISNVLRIYGREFDELKQYIDSIKIGNNVTYDGIDNVPDYLLTDVVNLDGWDLKNIYPYVFQNNEYSQNDNNSVYFYPYSQYVTGGINNTYIVLAKNSGEFYYNQSNMNYYNTELTSSYQDITETNNKLVTDDSISYNGSKELSRGGTDKRTTHMPPYKDNYPYFSNERFSLSDINTNFYRLLKINSRYILRNKGTLNGIEMLLSLFGLKSKRWVEKYNEQHSQTDVYSGFTAEKYDYEIKEYSTFMYPILDNYNESLSMNTYNYYNKSKLISYDTEDYYNGIYNDYQGLPVISFSGTSGNILYPYFNKDTKYDGNLYYQMNGGWMKISPFDFDIDNNIVYGDNLYSETVRGVKSVFNIQELLNMSLADIKEGEIVYVSNISNKYVIIDGTVYDINYEIDANGNTARYISVFYDNNSVIIGNEIFNDNINVSDYNTKNTESGISNVKIIDMDTLTDGDEIKIYIYDNNGNDSLFIYSDSTSVSNVKFYKEYLSDTHYYKLMTLYGYQEISDFGWKALKYTDNDYKNINRLINYNKGNNPHNGNKIYDNGYSYMEHFYELFKYPLDEELFDNSAFDNDYYAMESALTSFGFVNLAKTSDITYIELSANSLSNFYYNQNNTTYYNNDLSSSYQFVEADNNGLVKDNDTYYIGEKQTSSSTDSNGCQKSYMEIEDDKIHIFSNIIKPATCNGQCSSTIKQCQVDNKNRKVSCETDSIIESCKWLSGNTVYSVFTTEKGVDTYITDKNDANYINDRVWIKKEILPSNFNNNTYSVVNTKRIDINFRNDIFNNNSYTENTKYLLAIINNYLKQMMPSNAICNLNFNQ